MAASHYEIALLAGDAYKRASHFVPGHPALISPIDREIVVAVPGTHPTQLADWLCDLDARPKPFAQIGFCHKGFGSAAVDLWNILDLKLPRHGQRIVYTGHSLGGAIALDLAGLHAASGRSPCRVITFGAPRVAFRLNHALIALIGQALEAIQYERHGDIVPGVPWPPFFTHPAKRIKIGEAVRGLEGVDPLVNHEIARYIADIANLAHPSLRAL